MLQIKNYFRCVYENKFTLTGYISAFVVAGINTIGPELGEYLPATNLVLGLSTAGNLLMTMFGLETLVTYNKVSDYLKQTGGQLDDHVDHLYSAPYCTKAGRNLAKKKFLAVEDFASHKNTNYT